MSDHSGYKIKAYNPNKYISVNGYTMQGRSGEFRTNQSWQVYHPTTYSSIGAVNDKIHEFKKLGEDQHVVSLYNIKTAAWDRSATRTVDFTKERYIPIKPQMAKIDIPRPTRFQPVKVDIVKPNIPFQSMTKSNIEVFGPTTDFVLLAKQLVDKPTTIDALANTPNAAFNEMIKLYAGSIPDSVSYTKAPKIEVNTIKVYTPNYKGEYTQTPFYLT